MIPSMPELRIFRPRDVNDALAARRQHPESRYIAGGTDLLVHLRRGHDRPDLLIDLHDIDELSDIRRSDQGVRIGAGVTIATLATSALIMPYYRAIGEAAAAIGAPGHRALGTLGGNLCLETRCIYYNQSEWWRQANGICLKQGGDRCHAAKQSERCYAAYCGDLAPALLALGAEVEVANGNGRRREPLEVLFADDGRAHLALAKDELVVAVHLPAAAAPSAYAKARLRGAIDFPLAGVAVALEMADGALSSLRIAMTGTNSRPILLAGSDGLIGRPIDETALEEVERLVKKQVSPMRTTLASTQYRRLAAAALARRLVATLFKETAQTSVRESVQ